jgi:hypothetical protein
MEEYYKKEYLSPENTDSVSNSSKFSLPYPLEKYSIDFTTMLQINVHTHYERSIRRIQNHNL